MKNTTYRFAAVAAVLLTLSLVFMMPGAAADVAKIGNTAYPSLQAAVDGAVDGDIITLLVDNETTDGVLITDKKLTIDLNGKTFTVSEGASTNNRNFKINGSSAVIIRNGVLIAKGDYSSGAYGTIRTEDTANVTLTNLKLYNYRGNGLNIKALTGTKITILDTEIYAQYGGGVEAAGATIELTNVTVEQKGMYTAPYNSMTISVNGGGKAIVHSGTYTTECLTAEEAYNQGTSHGPWAAGVLNSGGTLIINGGTFTNDNYGEDALATAARGLILADTGAVVEINDGTFNALKSIIDIQNNLGDASKNPKGTISGGIFSADPTNDYVKIADGHKVISNEDGTYSVTAEAKIGNTFYSNLSDAVAAANAGDTITLLKDVVLTESISVEDEDEITVEGNGKTITSSIHTFLLKGGMLTLGEGLNVKSTGGCAVYITGGKLVTNANLNSTSLQAAIQGNGNRVGDVIINGGTITGPVAIYHPQNGNLTVNGGSIIGGTGIEIRAGTLTVNGGEISGTEEFDERKHDSGNTVMGVGIAVSQHTTAHNTVAVINGGSISGEYALYEKNLTTGAKDTDALDKITLSINAGTLTGNIFSENTGAFITGGTFSSNPSAYIASGYEVVQPGDKYLVQKYVDRSSSSSSSSTTEPETPEEPVEPETPTDEPVAGEPTVETEVTDGGEVTFDTPAEPENPDAGEPGDETPADAPAELAVTGVVLPEGTDSEVAFIPVSEKPAPAGKEENTKKVFEINVPKYEKGKPATVKFTMTLAELTKDGKTAADVALWHHDEETGEWTKLVTTFVIKDGIVYFEAITFDFSPFAIVYEDTELPTDEPETPEQPTESPAPILAVLAGLGAAVVLRRK